MGTVGLLLIVANVLVSYKGLKDLSFLTRYKFEVDGILKDRDYQRLVSSGFLHVSWFHLIFNMISFYSFSEAIETMLGGWELLLLYSASLIGGNLLALFIHRQHGDYTAVGASGAVAGVIFSSIALFPSHDIGFILIPIDMPGWFVGLLYMGISIWGIKSQRGNIGHEAHLGGALVGLLATIAMRPEVLLANYLTITVVAAPTLIFLYLIVTRPQILLISQPFRGKKNAHLNVDQRYNADKASRQQEIDQLLDKVSRKGYDALSKREKQRLKELSN